MYTYDKSTTKIDQGNNADKQKRQEKAAEVYEGICSVKYVVLLKKIIFKWNKIQIKGCMTHYFSNTPVIIGVPGFTPVKPFIFCRESWTWPGLAIMRGTHPTFSQIYSPWFLGDYVPLTHWETEFLSLPQILKLSKHF